jgi:hypothetical protein
VILETAEPAAASHQFVPVLPDKGPVHSAVWLNLVGWRYSFDHIRGVQILFEYLRRASVLKIYTMITPSLEDV